MIESKRFDIIQNLEVQRTFVFDYLRSKGVLDGEDCELIHSEKTTSLKVGKFVDLLAKKGPNAYQHLLDSLQLDNPFLFEKLTGEEANATTSPIMTKLKDSYLGVGAPLVNGELELLSKHLEQSYGDLHEMSCKFEEVVQRKKSIEERLEITICDLQQHQEEVVHLKKQIDSERSPTTQQKNPNWTKWLQYADTLRKEKSDRDIYIIALQTKLMSTKEKLEEQQKKNDSLQAKNEELQSVIDEVRENYKNKRFESLRLSERIQRQGDEIKRAEETTRKYRESQFRNMKLREEKERLQEDLDELHKWTEELKTKFDIVEYEKERTLTTHTEIIADFGNVQEELTRCKEEMNEVQSIAADLRERIRHLEHDRQTYKKQRDCALTARREAMLDRDKAYLERNQAVTKYNDIKAKSETKLEQKILQLKSYDELVARSDVMEEEVKQVKIKLRQTERELEEMKLNSGLEGAQKSDEDEIQNDSERPVPEITVVEPTAVNPDGKAKVPDRAEYGRKGNSLSPVLQLVDSLKRRCDSSCYFSCGMQAEESFPFDTCPIRSPKYPVKTVTFPDILREDGIQRKKATRKPVRVRRNSCDDLLDSKLVGQSDTSDKIEAIGPMQRDETIRRAIHYRRCCSDGNIIDHKGTEDPEKDQPLEPNCTGSQSDEASPKKTIINFL